MKIRQFFWPRIFKLFDLLCFLKLVSIYHESDNLCFHFSFFSLSLSLQLSIRTWSWSIDHGCGRQHRITLGSLVRIVQNLWKTPELWLWCQCQQFNWGNTYVRLFEIILYIFQKTHEIDFNNEKILELWFFFPWNRFHEI